MSDLSRQVDLCALQAACSEVDLARRFSGVGRLYGALAQSRFAAAHVAVVGIGGVGSWAAEALARSAVGQLSLIDLDHVAESNTNRQIHALGDEYGRAKVTAMAQRIGQINPAARVRTIEEFVSEDNVDAIVHALGGVDVLLDCIDQVRAKAALIAACRRHGIAVVTCGAAGGRVDPTRIRADDLARVAGDPLLAKLRYRLRRAHGFPAESASGRVRKFGVTAVFSDEPIRRPPAHAMASATGNSPAGMGTATTGALAGLNCAGYGSAVTVTAPLGFAAAARALEQLTQLAGASARRPVPAAVDPASALARVSDPSAGSAAPALSPAADAEAA